MRTMKLIPRTRFAAQQSTCFQADSGQKIVGESPTKRRKVDRGSVGNLFSNCIFNGAVTINVSKEEAQ